MTDASSDVPGTLSLSLRVLCSSADPLLGKHVSFLEVLTHILDLLFSVIVSRALQPSAAAVPRLPLAPMFDINQVLSAINQTVPSAAAATGYVLYDATSLHVSAVCVGICHS